MGRTAVPRSWRTPDLGDVPLSSNSTQPESAPVASTSSAVLPPLLPVPHPSHRPSSRVPSQVTPRQSQPSNNLSTSASLISSATDQIRRSVLPAGQREPPWRAGATTAFGGLAAEQESNPSTSITSNNIRISRAARASWNAAFNDTSDFPSASSMLPPRMGTPVPLAQHTTAESLLAPLQAVISQLGSTHSGPLPNEDLTAIGRRARGRERLASLEASNSSRSVSSLVHSLNLETLERAQLAVEGSRIALEEARLAIGVALRNSETRLGRLAELIRTQLQNDTNTPLPPLPRASETSDIEAERNEYLLERSLANLRAASLEIDRVLAASNATVSPAARPIRASAASVLPLSNFDAPGSAQTTAATSNPLFPSLLEPTLPTLTPWTQFSSRFAGASRPETATAERPDLQDPPALSSDPWRPVALEPYIRQPMPRRPIRYLRASQVNSNGSTRLRSLTQEFNSHRLTRPQRAGAGRNVAVQVSLAGYADDTTSSLARNVLTTFEQRAAAREALLMSVSDDYDEDDPESSEPSSRPTGHRQTGRWIRLDANGDEISGDVSNNVPLGWSWAATVQVPNLEEDKLAVPSIPGTQADRSATAFNANDSIAEVHSSIDMVGR